MVEGGPKSKPSALLWKGGIARPHENLDKMMGGTWTRSILILHTRRSKAPLWSEAAVGKTRRGWKIHRIDLPLPSWGGRNRQESLTLHIVAEL